jgi:hypothetical protein
MTTKLLLKSASGAAPPASLDVDDVFSTYLYTGNGSTSRDITNNIDLSTQGGLVWIKGRTIQRSNTLFDTERGASKHLKADSGTSQATSTTRLNSFLTTGFNLKNDLDVNGNTYDYVSWSFRSAPKFFDVVSWTGNGAASRQISHSLGTTVGAIFVKSLDASDNWVVFHKEIPSTKRMTLNETYAASIDSSMWDNTDPTASHFTVDTNTGINGNGKNYVAYLFAHNDGDGDFGPNADQDIIKCGSYTGNSSGENDDNGTEINLGFEPQWIMIKSSTWGSGNWQIFDTMRGITARPTSTSRDGDDAVLLANENNTEDGASSFLRVTPTGFKLESDNSSVNSSSHSYIYVAIRRGPLAEPESATDVFAVDQGDNSTTNPQFVSNFVTDFALWRATTAGANWETAARLTGKGYLRTNSTTSELGPDNDIAWDFMTGHYGPVRNSDFYSWMWKRAPSYFDVVAYTGNGTAGRTVNHNLGVAPEMIWVKQRNVSQSWQVYHSGMDATAPEDYYMQLNSTSGRTDSANRWNDTAPTSSVFTVGSGAAVNGSPDTYIAYLFATVAGVSKCGSYTGDGSTSGKTIDCGFSNGAKFILIKAYGDNSNDMHWYVFDSVRGITNGNDPWLELDTTEAEQTVGTAVKPDNSGFKVTYTTTAGFATVNVFNETYIFYAVAA